MAKSNLKTKHILINLTTGEYKQLKDKAIKEDRTITNIAYLIVKEGLTK